MSKVTYLTRADWGAGPLGSGHVVPHNQFVGLVVHHTVIVLPDYDHDLLVAGDLDDCVEYMRRLQHARPDLGDEVPYSFVGFEGATDGEVIVAEGRGFGVTGAHTIGYNSTRYGYALAGDYTNHAPTSGQWEGARLIGRQLDDPINAQPTLEHRDVYATQCPGASTPAPALAQPPFLPPFPDQREDSPVNTVTLPDGTIVNIVIGTDDQTYYSEKKPGQPFGAYVKMPQCVVRANI